MNNVYVFLNKHEQSALKEEQKSVTDEDDIA